MYNSVENRFLGGAILNSLANTNHKLYCQIDLSDNVARQQFRNEQYNRIFYETAVTQFVDNNNEDTVNSAVQAQIEMAQKRIGSFKDSESALPFFQKLPYDLTTRVNPKDTLPAGSTLANMDFLRSKNGLFAAVMKRDNNLCIYLVQDVMATTEKLGCTGTANDAYTKGELKLSSLGAVTITNSATQASIFAPKYEVSGENFFLIMQNDGNLVLYNSVDNPFWSSNTD